MKLISWNVNGIRAIIRKGFPACLAGTAADRADVICLQEVRATGEQAGLDIEGYRAFWNPGPRRGYSGTAVFTKVEPLSVAFGMDPEGIDQEGRIITLEFGDFYLVNCYTPNSGAELQRLAFRTERWDPAFLEHCTRLGERKGVVLCGDLNVAHKEIDIHDPKSNEGSAGFTPAERRSFDKLLAAGFIDTFRRFNSEGGNYTWWDYKTAGRRRNAGWRIDYFCVSEGMAESLDAAAIASEVVGSDHCPVTLTLR
jgi:exodeoxyribonuclease-3